MRDHTQQASLLLHSLFNLRKDFCSEHDSETRSELRSSQCSQICVHPDSNPSSNLSSHRDPHLHSRWYSADDFLENMSNDRGVPAAEHRLLRKTYLALIGASDLPDHFTITQPIGKLPYPTLGYVYGATPDGRPAYSEGRVLWREGDRTLLEITILTGRPHQIRIHLASVGYPLLGDPLYAAGGVPHLAAVSPAAKLPVPGDCGYWLHAHQLTFRHPATGEPMHFTSPAPVFTSAREAWQFLGS
ncbi:MAG: hypothetical protein D6742_06680 [Cyanobacteria bacterium J069]|nr:MAG: hypothetical protein D6742_06680 [Cyanobacteria bacterium J069]